MGTGILAVVFSATIMGIMPSMQKQLMMDGLPIFSLMFFTNLIISLVTLAMAKLHGRSVRVPRNQWLQAVVMGVLGMAATAMLINTAYLFMPVGTVTMLHFLYPTVVCVVMGTLFREGFSRLQVAAIVVSIAGMLFLTGKNGALPPAGILLAVISAFTYGGYLIANEKGPANEMALEVKLFYVSLPGGALCRAGPRHRQPGSAQQPGQLVPAHLLFRPGHSGRLLPDDVRHPAAGGLHRFLPLHAGAGGQCGVRHCMVL